MDRLIGESGEFVLTLLVLVCTGGFGYALVRLAYALKHTAVSLRELAAVTAHHEQAVSACVAALKGCDSRAPLSPRRRA